MLSELPIFLNSVKNNNPFAKFIFLTDYVADVLTDVSLKSHTAGQNYPAPGYSHYGCRVRRCAHIFWQHRY